MGANSSLYATWQRVNVPFPSRNSKRKLSPNVIQLDQDNRVAIPLTLIPMASLSDTVRKGIIVSILSPASTYFGAYWQTLHLFNDKSQSESKRSNFQDCIQQVSITRHLYSEPDLSRASLTRRCYNTVALSWVDVPGREVSKLRSPG
jgi:hypothetical protein